MKNLAFTVTVEHSVFKRFCRYGAKQRPEDQQGVQLGTHPRLATLSQYPRLSALGQALVTIPSIT